MAYQVMHSKQVESKKAVLAAAAQVDDMYDMLAAYEQKVGVTRAPVRCVLYVQQRTGTGGGLALFRPRTAPWPPSICCACAQPPIGTDPAGGPLLVLQIPTTDAVKHDDLREASGTFVTELTAGKEFMADHKVAQMEALEANIARTHEELASIMTSLNKGAWDGIAHGRVGREVCRFVELFSWFKHSQRDD